MADTRSTLESLLSQRQKIDEQIKRLQGEKNEALNQILRAMETFDISPADLVEPLSKRNPSLAHRAPLQLDTTPAPIPTSASMDSGLNATAKLKEMTNSEALSSKGVAPTPEKTSATLSGAKRATKTSAPAKKTEKPAADSQPKVKVNLAALKDVKRLPDGRIDISMPSE